MNIQSTQGKVLTATAAYQKGVKAATIFVFFLGGG